MLFSLAEIEMLRLAGWFKSIPLELREYDTELFSPAGIASLCLHRLLYVTQNGQYLRLTPTGWELLSDLGYPYTKDAGYITDPQKIRRRTEAARMMFTCYRAGIGIFAETPEQLITAPTFLSSAAARRNKGIISSKVWAGCRLCGILRLADTAYIVHFVDDQGLQFQSEMSLFHRLVANRCENTAGIYAANRYREAAHFLLTEPPLSQDRKRANGWRSFREACKSTRLPLLLLECSDIGALQLQVMGTPGYREKILHLGLGSGYAPPPDNMPDVDALWDGTPTVMAVDMDIKRLSRAYRTAKHLGFSTLRMLALPEQLDTLGELFYRTGMMELYGISKTILTSELGLELYEPSFTQPYQTKEGGTLIDSHIPNRRKAGGTAKPKAGTPQGQKR